MSLDTRYLEKRSVRGKVGFAWNNRHAAQHGFKAEWLGYDPVAAAQRADHLNKLYDAARAGSTAYATGTLGWWMAQIEKSDEHNARPDETRAEVERTFERWRDTPLVTAPIADISGKQVKKVLAKLRPVIGVPLTHRMGKWLRFAFQEAAEEKKIDFNPLRGVRIQKPVPRQVIIWESEVEALIAYWREKKRPSLALGVRFAYDTTQRQADVLKFPWTRWLDGDILVRQAKTGANRRIPALPELCADIAETSRVSTQIIVSEETGQPYKRSDFSHHMTDAFRDLKLVDEESGKPKVFQDLRRSGIVRLALAGCTIPEIASISGHSYKTTEQILETYLPRTTPMARQAIRKLLDARKKA